MTGPRLPTVATIWAVNHITTRGPVTDHFDTEQQALNHERHLKTGSTYYHATAYASTYIIEHTAEENQAA